MSDLRVLRSDLSAFAAEVGEPMAPFQVNSLALETTITACTAPRGGGKSRSLALLALHHAFARSEAVVLVVSASEDSARRLLAVMRRMASASELLRSSVVDEGAALLRLSNGSTITCTAASERAIRGFRASLLVVDEAALISDEVLVGAALPTISATPGSRVVMASSATSASGFFYDTAARGRDGGDEHVRSFHWRLSDCRWIAPSVIAAMRASMTPSRFAAEMEGVFDAGGDLLFPRRLLDRATADYATVPLARLVGPAAVFAAQDWGASRDRSAFVGLSRFAGQRCFGVRCVERWPAGAELPGVVEAVVASPAVIDVLIAERNGLGEMAVQSLAKRLRERPAQHGGGVAARSQVVDAQDLDAFVARQSARRRAVGVRVTNLVPHWTSALSKATSFSALRWMLDEGTLVLPASALELRRELELIRVDLAPGGGERIEASSGHDDLADALSMALWARRHPATGRWRCELAALADGGTCLPEPALAPGVSLERLERVSTASGASVPRTPAWQSPRGVRVTLPAAPVLAAAPEDRRLTDIRAAVRDALTHTERS